MTPPPRKVGPVASEIAKALARGAMTVQQLVEVTGHEPADVRVTVYNMIRREEIRNLHAGMKGPGLFALRDGPTAPAFGEPRPDGEIEPAGWGVSAMIRSRLERGAMSVRQLAALTGFSVRQVGVAATNLVTRGDLVNLRGGSGRGPGLYALACGPHVPAELPELDDAMIEDADEPIKPRELARQSTVGLDLQRAWSGLPLG